MNDLVRPSRVSELLRAYGLNPSKGLGQNFLVDRHALEKIVGAADVHDEDVCLEIGPGLGTLTRELAERARTVLAIEKDKKLTPVLAETLADYANIELQFSDALEVDYRKLLEPYSPPFKVVANLPYYVTTPLIMQLLETGIKWGKMVFLVQREVAERMTARPGTEACGSLSLAVQYYAQVKTIAVIPPNAFFPPPKVSSAVVLLEGRDKPGQHFGLVNEKLFFALIRAAFGQRRKTLLNALSAGLDVPKADIQRALAGCGIPESLRGETLGIESFVKIANQLT
ncbi:MAG: dimethyladenosine transferase [Bacillota bacterium]|nr:MAG: dimethyladenosine transferase [Bacillota bacterium]